MEPDVYDEFEKRAWNSGFTGGMGKRAWNSGFTSRFRFVYLRDENGFPTVKWLTRK